jgi:hypothetical protein
MGILVRICDSLSHELSSKILNTILKILTERAAYQEYYRNKRINYGCKLAMVFLDSKPGKAFPWDSVSVDFARIIENIHEFTVIDQTVKTLIEVLIMICKLKGLSFATAVRKYCIDYFSRGLNADAQRCLYAICIGSITVQILEAEEKVAQLWELTGAVGMVHSFTDNRIRAGGVWGSSVSFFDELANALSKYGDKTWAKLYVLKILERKEPQIIRDAAGLIEEVVQLWNNEEAMQAFESFCEDWRDTDEKWEFTAMMFEKFPENREKFLAVFPVKKEDREAYRWARRWSGVIFGEEDSESESPTQEMVRSPESEDEPVVFRDDGDDDADADSDTESEEER